MRSVYAGSPRVYPTAQKPAPASRRSFARLSFGPSVPGVSTYTARHARSRGTDAPGDGDGAPRSPSDELKYTSTCSTPSRCGTIAGSVSTSAWARGNQARPRPVDGAPISGPATGQSTPYSGRPSSSRSAGTPSAAYRSSDDRRAGGSPSLRSSGADAPGSDPAVR